MPTRKRFIPVIIRKLRERSTEDVMKDLGVSVDDQVREGQDATAGRVDHAETFDAVPDIVQRPQRMESPVQNADVLDTRLATRLDPLLDVRILVGDRSHAGGGAGKKYQTRGGKGGLGKILRTWRRKCVFLLPQIDSQPADPVVDIEIPLPTRFHFYHRFPP